MNTEYEALLARIRSDQGLARICYLSNNAFAYYADLGDEKGKDQETKIQNFVPTYDKWCLYCKKKGVSKRCLGCKTIYFCDRTCQAAAWPTHSRHCGRNQFCLCATCGAPSSEVKCDKCPVSWCSEECKNKIFAPHCDYDCDNFSRLFSR